DEQCVQRAQCGERQEPGEVALTAAQRDNTSRDDAVERAGKFECEILHSAHRGWELSRDVQNPGAVPHLAPGADAPSSHTGGTTAVDPVAPSTTRQVRRSRISPMSCAGWRETR